MKTKANTGRGIKEYEKINEDMGRYYKYQQWRLWCIIMLSLVNAKAYSQDSYMDFVQYALTAVQHDSIDKAIYYFQEAISADPHNEKNALIYSNLGKLFDAQGNLSEALKYYTKAVDEYPENLLFRRSRADLYLKSGIYEKAISDYNKIVEKLSLVSPNPTSVYGSELASIYSFIGYAYCKQTQYDEAQKYIDRSLEINPKEYMALLGSCIIQNQLHHTSEAKRQIDILVNMFPEKAEVFALRANMEMESELFELALQDINNAIELECDNKSYVLLRADILFNQHQYQRALADYLKAIELGVPRSAVNEKLQKCK